MDAYVMKPNTPFVTRHSLKRTPLTEEDRQVAHFIDSHDFSFSIHKDTEQVEISVTPKD